MPFVCLELPSSLPRDTASSLRAKIKSAIHQHLATKDPTYDYVVIHEESADFDSAMAGVTVDLRAGRSELQKQTFVDETCEALRQYVGIKRQNVYVLFRESIAANHYCGGKAIGEFVPPELRNA
jgi:phenylpyruvate tautomerase PptA (4-oxalocrotonate tautomerase family)